MSVSRCKSLFSSLYQISFKVWADWIFHLPINARSQSRPKTRFDIYCNYSNGCITNYRIHRLIYSSGTVTKQNCTPRIQSFQVSTTVQFCWKYVSFLDSVILTFRGSMISSYDTHLHDVSFSQSFIMLRGRQHVVVHWAAILAICLCLSFVWLCHSSKTLSFQQK